MLGCYAGVMLSQSDGIVQPLSRIGSTIDHRLQRDHPLCRRSATATATQSV